MLAVNKELGEAHAEVGGFHLALRKVEKSCINRTSAMNAAHTFWDEVCQLKFARGPNLYVIVCV